MSRRQPPSSLVPGFAAWDEFTLHRLSPDGRIWETWHVTPVSGYDPSDAYEAIEITRGDRCRFSGGWRSTGYRPFDEIPATDDEIREAVCAEVRKLPVRR